MFTFQDKDKALIIFIVVTSSIFEVDNLCEYTHTIVGIRCTTPSALSTVGVKYLSFSYGIKDVTLLFLSFTTVVVSYRYIPSKSTDIGLLSSN